MIKEETGLAATPVSLSSLFWIFFRVACTSFGGFMAMISVVQNVVVERKKLLAHQDMLDGISLGQILPGPVAVNVCAYVGYRLRGGAGALVCAVAAVLPSLVIILMLSVAYFRYGQIPAVSRVFMGILPAVAAIIVAAAWNMGRKSVTGVREGVLAAGAAAVLLGIGGLYSTLGIILGAGFIGWWWFRVPTPANPSPTAVTPAAAAESPKPPLGMSLIFLTPLPAMVAPLASFEPVLLSQIFFTFASMSLMLFGGAYVFIPLIQEIVVQGQGWVTQKEFIDAVAMAQIAPGAILVSAAFVGLKVAGLAGALAATVGIYLPSALLMVGCTHVLERIKRSAVIGAALRGVRPAVVGMIFAAAVSVGQTVAPVWVSVAIFAGVLLALLRFRVEVVWVVPPAGVLGWLLF